MRSVRRRAPKGRQVVIGDSLPAPTGGWDAVSPIANMKKDRALVLDNWFPTPTDVRVRRGYQVFASVGSSAIETLMVYMAHRALDDKLFSASSGKISDISGGGLGADSVTGLGSNRWQWVNFTTPAGLFLWCCNGTDDPRHYDGSAWAAPALTLTGFTADEIINVNAHKGRLWFVFKDSTQAGYLPTQSIAGTVSNFDLGPQFTKGGYLVAMATWTHDGGLGPDDYAVFISSEGQVAIYKGTDPSSSDTWSIVGVFDLGPPIGYRCFTKVGADLALINIDGVLPISKALGIDRGAAAAVAITKNINNAMNTAARSYKGNFGWQLQPYPRGTYVLLNVPLQEGETQHQYVMNTLTGAWCRFTNQNFGCWAVFKDELYGGGNDGLVYKADQGALDVDSPVDAIGQTAYSYYGSQGEFKQWKAVQPILTTDANVKPALGLSTDFKDNAVLGTPSTAESAEATYDNAIFDQSTFAVEGRVSADWASVTGQGYCASLHFRSQTGPQTGVSLWGRSLWASSNWSAQTTSEVVMAFNGFNAIYEKGLVL